MTTKFGPMNQKCFISRTDLLVWINNILKVNTTKIEQLGSGCIYCQLLDVIYPEKVPLHKVKWNAKLELDFLHNFKILQTAFNDLKVNKTIPVTKLAKAKYQDNLEFGQWMKRFFDVNCKEKGKGYDALKRRNNVEPDLSFCGQGAPPKYTLVFKNSQQIQLSQEQQKQIENTSTDIADDVQEQIIKKQKIEKTDFFEGNFGKQSIPTPQQDMGQCKFFNKKTESNPLLQNKENLISQDSKENVSIIDYPLKLKQIQEVLSQYQNFDAKLAFEKVKSIIF